MKSRHAIADYPRRHGASALILPTHRAKEGRESAGHLERRARPPALARSRGPRSTPPWFGVVEPNVHKPRQVWWALGSGGERREGADAAASETGVRGFVRGKALDEKVLGEERRNTKALAPLAQRCNKATRAKHTQAQKVPLRHTNTRRPARAFHSQPRSSYNSSAPTRPFPRFFRCPNDLGVSLAPRSPTPSREWGLWLSSCLRTARRKGESCGAPRKASATPALADGTALDSAVVRGGRA